MLDGQGHSLVFLCLLAGSVQALDDDQKTGLIVGCSIGGAILIIVVITLLVYCCKSSRDDKERNKKVTQYLQYQDATLGSPPHHIPQAHYKAVNGYANGHAGQHKAVPKLGRSLSDVQPSRASYVMPEWRKNHERGDSGSQLSGYDNRSDISAGIWTSNPTMTRGVYPGHVVGVNGVSVPNGRPKQPHASEPAIATKSKPDKKKDKPKHGHNNNNLLLAVDEETMFAGAVDSRAKVHTKVVSKPYKKSTEDKKKLIPANGKGNTRHTEPQTLVKVYSNPNVSAPDVPVAQHGPYVAKVYSDYQRPRDFLPESQTNPKTRSKVAKAYSAHTKDDIPRVVASHTDLRPGDRHVAKILVGDNNNYLPSRSSGDYTEPYRGQPITQSDMFIHRAAERRVVRSQSNLERGRAPDQLPIAHQKQGKRSASQVVKQEPHTSGAAIHSGTKDRGVHKPGVRHSHVQKHRDDKKQLKASSAETKDVKRRKKDKNYSPKGGDPSIKRASTGASIVRGNQQGVPASRPVQPKQEQPDIHIMPVIVQPESPVILNELRRSEQDSPPPSPRISESSSVPRNPQPVASSSVEAPDKAANADIYATPLKRESRPVSDIVVVEVNTPVSPDPPPVPPVTSLRDETATPTPSSSSRRRKHSSSASDGDGLSTGRAIKAFDFLDTYTVTSRDVHDDQISVNTTATGREGKNVIGDVFQFLDDFDDMSYGEPEKF